MPHRGCPRNDEAPPSEHGGASWWCWWTKAARAISPACTDCACSRVRLASPAQERPGTVQPASPTASSRVPRVTKVPRSSAAMRTRYSRCERSSRTGNSAMRSGVIVGAASAVPNTVIRSLLVMVLYFLVIRRQGDSVSADVSVQRDASSAGRARRVSTCSSSVRIERCLEWNATRVSRCREVGVRESDGFAAVHQPETIRPPRREVQRATGPSVRRPGRPPSGPRRRPRCPSRRGGRPRTTACAKPARGSARQTSPRSPDGAPRP